MFTDVNREVHYNSSNHVTDVKPKPTTPVTLHLSITALLSVSRETPAGQECEDWRISLSRRYSEPVPFCLTSFTGQHFCKCNNKNCIRGLHFNTASPEGPWGKQIWSQLRGKEKGKSQHDPSAEQSFQWATEKSRGKLAPKLRSQQITSCLWHSIRKSDLDSAALINFSIPGIKTEPATTDTSLPITATQPR